MKRKSQPLANTRSPDKADKIIGANVRKIRLDRGMSQMALGDEVGVTFQQIQKVEKGVNRIAASRLLRVARALDEPVQAFFEGA